ncbi:hypothetical protein K461DRAFT_277675 [Myriangium duriaei CBS 260.36]|uniref:2EXR domain-containing protein n=1 Tax=Myriangium duriaei CBS 260.36 TaxID=1168546 RepID=A0A9P4J5T3_9PEZI|nr:hypothetical protein K461DRAFT_277675 [Myriangium duriaei CBS 260.36]
MTATPSTFPAFAKLPLELRRQIWHYALPSSIKPTLYEYRAGCWRPELQSPLPDSHSTAPNRPRTDVHFRYDLCGEMHYRIPLAFVNHEARAMAVAWTRKNAKNCSHCCLQAEAGGTPTAIHPFNPNFDAIYVASDVFENFTYEPMMWIREPDLRGHRVIIYPADVRFLAIPESLLRTRAEMVARILGHYCRVHVLLVVVESSHGLGPFEYGKQHWEFVNCPGSVVWDTNAFRSHGFWAAELEPLHMLIDEAAK